MRKKKVKLGVGLHEGIPAEVYHADPCAKPSLSASIAQILITQSPRHAWCQHPRLNKNLVQRQSDKFDLGSAAHSYILEGAKDSLEVIDAESYRTKEAQALRDAARESGKIPVLPHQMADIKNMATEFFDAVERCPDLRGIFKRGKAEVTGVWKEGKNWMRFRTDWITNEKDLVIDYKTSENADIETFLRGPLANLGYDLKAAFYLHGLKKLCGDLGSTTFTVEHDDGYVEKIKTDKRRFVWIVQETEEPYAVSFVGYGEHMAEIAERKVERAISIWQQCVKSKSWPGYPKQIAWSDLPTYAEQRFSMFEAVQDGLLTAGGM